MTFGVHYAISLGGRIGRSKTYMSLVTRAFPPRGERQVCPISDVYEPQISGPSRKNTA
jgi:hypothetical protein